MAKIKSPEQVKRIDGRNCFLELLTSGLQWDKISLNFMSYDKLQQKGSRMSGSVFMYMDIPKAESFCEMVLSGKMAKLGEKAKADAAAKGYKYAPAVFTTMGGTPADKSTRDDGLAVSRQLKLTPGAKTDWVISAESGPGREEGTGIIAPAYVGGRPECIIRIPLSNEDLAGLALSIRSIIQLWYEAKFVPEVTPKKSTTLFKTGALEVSSSALDIDKLLVTINGAKFFLNDTKALLLGHDIVTSRILKLGKNTTERVYESFGGGKQKNGAILCRVLSIASNGDGNWKITAESGPGSIGENGLIRPDWESPDKSGTAILTRNELMELGFALRGLSQAWSEARYKALIEEPVAKVQAENAKQLEALRKGTK